MAVSEVGKRLQTAAETEDHTTNPKRGNILVPAATSAELLRRVAESGCVITAENINANADAASNASSTAQTATSKAAAAAARNASENSAAVTGEGSLGLTSNEWLLLRSFLVARVRNVLEVAVQTLRRQQDNVDDKTTEVYKQQLATLSDFVLDSETVVGELAGWTQPMFTIQRLCELLLDPLRYNTNAAPSGDAFRADASKEQVIGALAPVLRPDKLQAALRRCILVAPSQITIGDSCI